MKTEGDGKTILNRRHRNYSTKSADSRGNPDPLPYRRFRHARVRQFPKFLMEILPATVCEFCHNLSPGKWLISAVFQSNVQPECVSAARFDGTKALAYTFFSRAIASPTRRGLLR